MKYFQKNTRKTNLERKERIVIKLPDKINYQRLAKNTNEM